MSFDRTKQICLWMIYIYIYIYILAADEDKVSHVFSHDVWWKFEYEDPLESKMTLWKDKMTLQKLGVISWKDRDLTNMDSTMKEKCPQGVCNGEGEYITHHTCSYGNDLDMCQATTCDCWSKQRNSPAGECKSNDGTMNQVYPHSIHEPIVEHQRPGDIPCNPRI